MAKDQDNQTEIEDILHSNTYNDRYDPLHHYSMMLWRPDSPIMQEDLNSGQSFLHNQFKLIGDHTIGNGTIISGMNINISKNGSSNKKLPNITDKEKNLLDQNDISAVNARINRDGYTKGGTVDVAPQSEASDNYTGVELFLPEDQSPKEFTVSFSITKETGTLHNIGFDYTGNATLKSELVDGNDVKNSPVNISLDDGKPHEVSATFKANGLLSPMYILANQGYDVTQSSNAVRFKLNGLMVNKGDEAAPWRLSTDDMGLPSQNRDETVTVSPGTIYLDGYVRQFGNSELGVGGQIPITGSGTEQIGVRLNRQLVRAQPNPDLPGSDLYDTTKGVPSQGERLADRIQYTVSLTYNDSNAITIYTLVNGQVYKNNSSTGNLRLDELLAKRMYDQSGSFRVSGLQFHTQADPLNSNMGNLVIDKGTAYVMGYGVYLTQSTTIPYQIPQETQSVTDEDVAQNMAYRKSWVSHQLSHQPLVKGSLTVVGSVQVGGTDWKKPIISDSTQAPTMKNGKFQPEIPDNHLIFDTPSMAKLPDIFQPTINHKNGSIGGGFNGNLTIISVDDKGKAQGAVMYDPDNDNTYVLKAVNPNYQEGTGGDHVSNDSIMIYDKQHPKNYYPAGSGVSIMPINDHWAVNFDFTEQQQAAIFGHVTGDTFYVQGAARHMFSGPDDNSTEPDYRVLSANDPNEDKSYNALTHARLQFGAKGESGLTPLIGCSDLEVSYQYYLAQVDTLTLDKNGNFDLISGIPAPLEDARPREQSDSNTLRLGYVVLLPDTFRSNCQFSSITRIPFSGLQDLAARVHNLELLEQNNMLNNQAKGYTNPQFINNTINDDFTTFATGDYTDPDMRCALDLADGMLSVNDSRKSLEPIYPKLDLSDNSYSTSNHLLMSSLHAEYRQEWQTAITSAIPVNNSSLPNGSTNGLLSITPNADTYIDCDGYEFDIDDVPTSVQLHNWFTYDSNVFPKVNRLDPSYYLQGNNSFGEDYNVQNLSQWTMRKETGNQTSQVGNEFMHSRTVNFKTSWAKPNGQGYYIQIDGQYDPAWKLSLQPSDNTGYDPTNHTLTADSHGNISGTFKLPDTISTGTHEITLTNVVTRYQKDGKNLEIGSVPEKSNDTSVLSTTYEANGIENDDIGTVKRTYNAHDNLHRTIKPQVAQSVLVEQDSTFTKVDLTFNNKPVVQDSSANVLVQLRSVNADNTPTDEVLAQATLPSSKVRVDGLPTTFRFDDPVFLSKGDWVAITVYSPSSGYSVNISTIPLIEAQDITYSTNNMAFTTSNGFEWDTPVNTQALTFTLYRASFDTNTEIAFKPYNLTHDYQKDFDTISHFALLADYVTPDNSSLDWQVKIGYQDSGDTVEYTTLPITRRTPYAVTDDITDSEESNNDYNPVTSVQLICHMNWDMQNVNANDTDAEEDIPIINSDTNHTVYSRVSPMINLGTVALSVGESKFNTDKDHLNITSYLQNNNTVDMDKINKTDGLYLTHDLLTYAPNYDTIITTFDTLNDDEQAKVIPIYSTDTGSTWHLYSGQSEYKNYPKVVNVDNNFKRCTYKIHVSTENGTNNQSHFKMGLIMLSNSPYHRPIVRRLTNTLSLENGYNTDNAQPYMNDNSGTTFAYGDNGSTY